MNAIDKLVTIAKNEVGYMEKNSKNYLYEPELNVGYNNFTKYWQDINPSYQGSSWCAAFVNWCYLKAFGKDNARKLLRHYPYIYVSTMFHLFDVHNMPRRGDIILFNIKGNYTHTVIVTWNEENYFETVEGNTNVCISPVPHGGGVCSRSYFIEDVPKTRFCTPDWSIIN